QPAAKSEAKPEIAPAPKSPMASISGNPRGEPLLFETNSTEIRPGAKNWWSVSVSPDSKWIATGQGDGNSKGEVKIWERETGTIKRVIPEPKGTRSVAYSPDGKVLATANYDAAIRFYDAKSFKLLGITEEASGGHKTGVNGLCFYKDGKYLASAGLDNTSRIWDVSAILAKAKSETVVAKPVAIFE